MRFDRSGHPQRHGLPRIPALAVWLDLLVNIPDLKSTTVYYVADHIECCRTMAAQGAEPGDGSLRILALAMTAALMGCNATAPISGLYRAHTSGSYVICGWVRLRSPDYEYPRYPDNRPFAASYSLARPAFAASG